MVRCGPPQPYDVEASSLQIFSGASQDVQSGQADGGQVQCGAVWLNGDAAHCQHLGRPLHGADAELERHAVNNDRWGLSVTLAVLPLI